MDFVTIRHVFPPITPDQLEPLDPRCTRVQFDAPLGRKDLRSLSEFMTQYPHVTLRMFWSGVRRWRNLEFLEHFGSLKRFLCEGADVKNIDGLRFLPEDLEYLGFRLAGSKHSLQCLRRFRGLRELDLNGQCEDIDVIGELTGLRSVVLSGMNVDLAVLQPLPRLARLMLAENEISTIDSLRGLDSLQILQLYFMSKIEDVDVVADLRSLKLIILDGLPRLERLPDCSNLTALRTVQLESVRPVRDLSPIARAPSLEELLVLRTFHLDERDFAPFVGHPTLARCRLGLGSEQTIAAAEELLGIRELADWPVKIEWD